MNLFDGLKPLCYISRVFGLAPFTLTGQTMEESRFFIPYSYVVLIVNIFLQSGFVFLIVRDEGVTILKSLILFIDVFTFFVNCIGSTFLILRNGTLILNDFIQLNKFCEETSFLPRHRFRQLKTISTWCFVFVFVCCLFFAVNDCIFWLAEVFNFENRLLLGSLTFVLCWRVIICSVICCYFVIVSNLIRLLYFTVNWNLKNLKETHRAENTFTVSRVFFLQQIRFFIQVDDFFKDLSDHWSSTFSFYSLCLCAGFCFEVVYSVMYLFIEFESFRTLLLSILWTFYFFLQLFVITLSSVLTTDQAEKTANYLHELFIDNDDPDLKEEIEIFSLQLLHRRVEFNACGFFKMDFSLLYSMVGAVTTYIIILMQFQGDRRATLGSCQVNCTNCSM